MKNKSHYLTISIIFIFCVFVNTSCQPKIEYEKFADYAIEMDSKSLNMTFEVANGREYNLNLLSGENTIIYPTGQVTFNYTLTNTTDQNYRFTVCLFWKEFTNELGCDVVTFIGQSSANLTHTVPLSPGSGELWIEGTDILIEPIGADNRPQYFSSILTVNTACPSDEKCCNYLPDGDCEQCVDESKGQLCP